VALSKARIIAVGETPYPHEREGIEFAEKALPDSDPYHLWALVDLLDPSTGRQHELDLVVLGYSCLYVVELKAYPGLIEGDAVDWIWVTAEGRRLWRDSPRGLAKRKAQILKSRLERALPGGVRAPWVEPLIFLSHPEVKLGLQPDGLMGVVRRNNFVDAITRHEFPGADPRHQGRAIDRPTMRAVVQALSAIGFRPRKGKLNVGSYELGALLDETQSFQDREAVHRSIPSQRRRARTYLVPEQTSVERRQQLLRAAEREAQLLHEVREHPNILTLTDYVADAPMGPTVLLDDFERGIPLDAFLRLEPALGFSDRIAILEQLAGALGHCHRREIVHGGLCPAAVLVRRGSPVKPGEPGPIETRLYNFQLGGSQSVEATSHWSALGPETWAVYQAPELRRDPTQRTVESDLFSLGAIGYLLLTGQPPGNTVAEVEARMKPRRCLDPRDASDAVPDQLAEAIAMATAEVLAARANDAAEWIDLVLESATGPAPVTEAERSPLDARKDDQLGAYKVTRVLGHGASSRVLEVEHDDSRYALKVSLGPDHDERLTAEAAVLGKLRHPRIVRLERTLTIAGRLCLLMSLAGQSLQRELAEHGTPSLDYASRYGIDLLSALAHLEEQDVLHRDVKPANMGVGAVGKKSQSLTLFDFSLAEVAVTELGVGTAAYRDPFLPQRGRWDAAADRYSAAITLYELLIGQRPMLDAEGAVTLAAERFDPSVRAALVAFFQAAFAAAASDRHATADEMRRAWERALEAQGNVAPAAEDEPEAAQISDEAIAALPATTPIQALPLSNRAKNALDRAGLLCVGDLRDLPQNRLSAMRGVGRQVAKDILAFRERWERLGKTGPPASEPAFFPGYRGADLMVQVAWPELPVAASDALVDAALRTLPQLAAAPKSQIVALARRHGFDAARLASAISREHDAAQARNQPTTIGAWIDALLPAGKKRHHHARALFGLDGKAFAGVRELAKHLRISTAAIYAGIGKSRAEWGQHPEIRGLVDEVHGVLDRAGGAMPLTAAGTELLTRIAHGEGPDNVVRACALARVVVELDKDEPDGIRFVRLDGDTPWLVRREDLEAPLEQLGAAADELASREVLAGPAEAHRALEAIVAETPLAALAADRLVRLAAAASRRAAASSRLELYPREMAGRRALELSAAILPGKITEPKLRELVAARYPDAAALPPRPELDDLVETFGLRYVSEEAVYARPGTDARALHTSLSSYTHIASLPTRGPEIEARTVTIHEFEDKVRTCLERRALLVLGVSAERAPDAELALTRRFGLVPRSFDALFLAELERQMAAGKVQERLVYDTDAGGVAVGAWPNLMKLARRTATALAATLLPPKTPLLLTQPGLIDRYQLVELLRSLVEAAKDDAAEPILLLVPGHERGVPKIGDTVIPDLLPGQWTWIPKAWIGAQLQLAPG
jgi:serine/threonine protein kinase